MALSFLSALVQQTPTLEKQAVAACELVQDELASASSRLHAITARPKDRQAALEKVVRKRYGRPQVQMTDIIGVRVVVFYPGDVNSVVTILRSSLDIHPNPKLSPDKRLELDVSTFGYRSVHIVARAKPSHLTRYRILRDRWFEIQVRSILEDSWAEFDHDVLYKARGAQDPKLIRRFSSLAAVLESVDQSFEDLRVRERDYGLTQSQEYVAGRGLNAKLDPTSLRAMLHAFLPSQPGWHFDAGDDAIGPYMAARLVDACNILKLTTVEQLRNALAEPGLMKDVAQYASASGESGDAISHVTRLLLLIGRRDAGLLQDCFSDMTGDPWLGTALGW